MPSFHIFYFTYSFKGFDLYSKSPNCDVGTNPALLFITSGILFTTLAQVSSTVDGFATVIDEIRYTKPSNLFMVPILTEVLYRAIIEQLTKSFSPNREEFLMNYALNFVNIFNIF